VTQVKLDKSAANVFSLQIGAGSKKPKQVSDAARGHFEAADVPIKRKVCEFRVSRDALLPVGTPLTAAHFVAGQHVDVTGHTIGKGFQGPMKRWGFSGLPASHGTTKKHRAHGSIGNSQDPGRVWKGKKMAGRMGNRKRTVQSVFVYKIDAARNLIYVKGQVPGKSGLFLKIKDALRKPPPLLGVDCVTAGDDVDTSTAPFVPGISGSKFGKPKWATGRAGDVPHAAAPYPAWGFGKAPEFSPTSTPVTATTLDPFLNSTGRGTAGTE
jgi:large subunit ribosomal protein L3